MSKETFTPEQKRELLANQYTKLVGSHYIRFTDAFWQEFGRRILAGEDRYAICRSMGYDPDVVERHIKYTKKIKLNARRHNVKFRSIQII
ncbi:MAG: HTH domain-containing protein [Erysipelotrichaceae bacterium]|nr:HTH domain-containing protein [Erysipelotrichaceae bacterium]